ncbi:yeats family-domain-containing protein [Pisolithus albus]|nr:yeats family-domain-containing protein [Pisolithus albus]
MAEARVRVRGVTIHRPIIYGNTATVLTAAERETCAFPDHTHRWTVAVRSAPSAPDSDIVGGADDLSYFIKRVTFKLHDTYSNPTRNIDKPPFELSETGWGEFEIQIRVHFVAESGEKPITLYHHLKLHPWSLTFPAPGTEPEIPSPENAAKFGPVHSWQYDEIVFTDPFQSFLTLLTAHPPTPLPKTSKNPTPFHTSYPASLEETRNPACRSSPAQWREMRARDWKRRKRRLSRNRISGRASYWSEKRSWRGYRNSSLQEADKPIVA